MILKITDFFIDAQNMIEKKILSSVSPTTKTMKVIEHGLWGKHVNSVY